MADVVLCKKFFLLVAHAPGLTAAFRKRFAAVGGRKRGTGKRRDHLVAGVEHQACNRLYRKPSCEIPRTFSGGETPVLVGEQRTGSGKILEDQPVLFQDFSVGGTDLLAIFVLVKSIALFLNFLVSHKNPPVCLVNLI